MGAGRMIIRTNRFAAGDPTSRGSRGGFSLVEIMIVIAIMAIIAAMAVPSYRTYMAKNRLNGAARQVMSDLMSARMMAVTLNRNVSVVFPPSAGASYTLDGTAKNIQTLYGYYDVTVSGSNNPVFTANGRLVGFTNAGITLTSATLSQTKTVTVSLAGRVKIN